jgi:hypothetical protein
MTGVLMRSKRHQQQLTRRIRRDRRRLGRFVVFAEMLADLRPISLFDQAAPLSKLVRAAIIAEHKREV